MAPDFKKAFHQLKFRWLPKHLNHITEKILFQKRNVSFLAINALFRQEQKFLSKSPEPFHNSFILRGFVSLQKNDNLRLRAEELVVVFQLDRHNNIIVITAYSENDEQ